MDLVRIFSYFVEKRSNKAIDSLQDLFSNEMLLYAETILYRSYLKRKYYTLPDFLNRIKRGLDWTYIKVLVVVSSQPFNLWLRFLRHLWPALRMEIFFSSWWTYLNLWKFYLINSNLLKLLRWNSNFFKPVLDLKNDMDSYLLWLILNLLNKLSLYSMFSDFEESRPTNVEIKDHILMDICILRKSITLLKHSLLNK